MNTFDDLKIYFKTGRSITKKINRKNVQVGYRVGVFCKLGDIELSEWEEMMEALITESGEMELFENLMNWVRDNCAFIKKNSLKEVRLYALELHSERIFENKEWYGFFDFNKNYSSEKIAEG